MSSKFISLCLTFALCGFVVITSPNAEASTGKTCKHSSALASKHCKHAHLHHQHVVFTRPQPASFVMDADTGKVLESENADSPRYPASLTKMMTLYLTFDALQKGKLTLDQKIPVSAHAASQPQTNIALEAGDRLAVKDAILSIVVRSANDSAVTLAEAMGGSEEGFAQKMTQTARKLGMKNTVFYNASGLPEPRQHTTARDMALLGLALKRDFPRYYPFFKTESFSYNGVTYPTHNHVMMRYDGVDGIKTGYIRASGFNLVTSAKKDNHSLIGVVLGGPSWRARDDKMIALLDQNFSRLSAKNTKSGTPEKQLASIQPAAKGQTLNEFDSEEATEGQGDLTSESEENAIESTRAVSKTEASNNAAIWGVQVGAYASKSDAVKAASNAMKQASRALGASKIAISDRDSDNQYYRARLTNLSESDAEAACKALSAKKLSCFTYKEE